MPSEVDKQDPDDLLDGFFYVIETHQKKEESIPQENKNEIEAKAIPPNMRVFYGL